MIGGFFCHWTSAQRDVLISSDRPTFGFAKDLGSVSSSSASVLFTIGVSQDDIINFAVNHHLSISFHMTCKASH